MRQREHTPSLSVHDSLSTWRPESRRRIQFSRRRVLPADVKGNSMCDLPATLEWKCAGVDRARMRAACFLATAVPERQSVVCSKQEKLVAAKWVSSRLSLGRRRVSECTAEFIDYHPGFSLLSSFPFRTRGPCSASQLCLNVLTIKMNIIDGHIIK